MSGQHPGDERDRLLWRRFSSAAGQAPLDPSDSLSSEDLAAWLDERLSTEERAALEERLARDPEALETVLWARSARPVPVPGELHRRILSSRETPRRERPGREEVVRARAANSNWLAWAALAASLALVSLGGFALGRAGYDDLHGGATGGLVAELVAGPDDETFGDSL